MGPGIIHISGQRNAPQATLLGRNLKTLAKFRWPAKQTCSEE